MTRTDVLFVEQFYHPEGWGGAELPRMLTTHLARSGRAVSVICGGDQYVQISGEIGPSPELSGVRICRLPRLFGGEFKKGRLLRQLWFYAALIPALFVRRRPQLVMVQTNPPFGVVLAALASLLWRRPLVVLAMDIYPDVLVAHGILSPRGLPASILEVIFRWAYRRARRVVSLGPVMTERLLRKGVESDRIREIPNWSIGAPGVVRGAMNRLVEEWGLEGKFVVLYSGNLGIAHEFDTFLGGFAQASRLNERLVLLVVGKGSRLAEVMTKVRHLGLEGRVQFRDFVPASRLPESLGTADMALVTLREGFEGLVVPSKLYSYMARGIPVLYVGPRSDCSIQVDQAGCGWVAEPGAQEAVAQCLAAAFADRNMAAARGQAGIAACESGYSADHSLRKYSALVAEVIG